jgi:hypothetical protein
MAAIVQAVSLGMVSEHACSAENGGSHAFTGAESFYAGVVPPPGFYYLQYDTFYSSLRLNDKQGGKAVPSFSVTQFASVNRFVYVSDIQFFGASVASQVLLPLVGVSARVMGMTGSKFNIGDIIVTPVMLGWHFNEWHFATAVSFFAPTGSYDRRDLVNTGYNYWSAVPAIAVSYLSTSGLEVSINSQYYFNSTNSSAGFGGYNSTGANYRSGQELTTDLLVAQHVGPWSLGVSAFSYLQVGSDTISDGASNAALQSGGGNKGRAYGVGPAVRYDMGPLSLTIQAQHEVAVRNRPQGERFWLKASYKF